MLWSELIWRSDLELHLFAFFRSLNQQINCLLYESIDNAVDIATAIYQTNERMKKKENESKKKQIMDTSTDKKKISNPKKTQLLSFLLDQPSIYKKFITI